MFGHGMYQCNSNKQPHLIDSIVRKTDRIADEGVFYQRRGIRKAEIALHSDSSIKSDLKSTYKGKIKLYFLMVTMSRGKS